MAKQLVYKMAGVKDLVLESVRGYLADNYEHMNSPEQKRLLKEQLAFLQNLGLVPPTITIDQLLSNVNPNHQDEEDFSGPEFTQEDQDMLDNLEKESTAKSAKFQKRLNDLRARKAAAVASTSVKKEAASTINKQAQVKTAACWTLVKTMLPKSDAKTQFKLATLLIHADASTLNSAVKQAALNNFWTKFAEDSHFNELLEAPESLEKIKKEIEKELKGEPKCAAVDKKADYEDPAAAEEEAKEQEKATLTEKITEAETAVDDLKTDIGEIEEQELDIPGVLNNADDKVNSLANEEPGDDFDSFFQDEEETMEPSETADLEGMMDGEEEGEEVPDFFSTASEADDMSDFNEENPDDFGDEFNEEPVDIEDIGDEWAESSDVDADSDHDDLFSEIMKDIDPGTFKTDRDTGADLPMEKAASKKPVVKKSNEEARKRAAATVGHPTNVAPTKEGLDFRFIESLLFKD